MKQKEFVNIVFIILVFIFAGASGYVILVKKPAVTAILKELITGNKTYNKTYVDEDFGFRFEYPDKYFISIGDHDKPNKWLYITSDPGKLNRMDGCTREYTMLAEKYDIALGQYELEAVKSKYKYIDNICIESKIIDGYKAIRVRGTGITPIGFHDTPRNGIKNNNPQDFILFNKGNTHIGLYPCSKQYYNPDEISQIFSSFRFVK